MKYILMMNTPAGGPYQIASWPAQDIKAHIAFMMKFAKKLSAAGELVAAEGLSGPDQAKRVRADASGEPVIRELKRVSSPGLRQYVGVQEIPRVRNGLGMAILSTSKGLMSDREARQARTGGELLAVVW